MYLDTIRCCFASLSIDICVFFTRYSLRYLSLKLYISAIKMSYKEYGITGGDNSNKRCFGTKPKLLRKSGDFSGNREIFPETRDNSGTLQKNIGTSKEFLFHVFIWVNLGQVRHEIFHK